MASVGGYPTKCRILFIKIITHKKNGDFAKSPVNNINIYMEHLYIKIIDKRKRQQSFSIIIFYHLAKLVVVNRNVKGHTLHINLIRIIL